MPQLTPLLLTIATLSMISCSSIQNASDTSASAVSKTANLAMSKMPVLPIIGPLPGQGPKIVKVHDKNLKKLLSGRELAQAHQRQNSYWIFGAPVEFEETIPPQGGLNMTESLLPPLSN